MNPILQPKNSKNEVINVIFDRIKKTWISLCRKIYVAWTVGWQQYSFQTMAQRRLSVFQLKDLEINHCADFLPIGCFSYLYTDSTTEIRNIREQSLPIYTPNKT